MLQKHMKADAIIIVCNKSLWQQVFGWAMPEFLVSCFDFDLPKHIG